MGMAELLQFADNFYRFTTSYAILRKKP
jgi:hypothetical protein